jgi:hypothetical protein
MSIVIWAVGFLFISAVAFKEINLKISAVSAEYSSLINA